MENKNLSEIEEYYDLKLDETITKIKKLKAKIILLQFPDGLKNYATTITNYLKEKTKKVEYLIWFGSCFGACDIPQGIENLKETVDLTIQFGHNSMMPSY